MTAGRNTRCSKCVNHTCFEKKHNPSGYYGSTARCYVWGCEVFPYACGCKFFEDNPNKQMEDTNVPEFILEYNTHEYKPAWGTLKIYTAFAKGDWYKGCNFQLDGGSYLGASCQPSWWGGHAYETERQAINAALDGLIQYVRHEDNAEAIIKDLQTYKFKNRQLSLF